MRLTRLLAPALLLLCAALGRAQTGYTQLSAYPTAMVADGHSVVTVTAVANSANGNPVPDGTEVLFSSDLGSFQNQLVATKSGYARANLIAGSIAGTATVTVKVLGFPIAPSTVQVLLVGDRSMLSSAKEYVEITSPTYLKFSPSDQILVSEAADRGVTIRYRDVEIQADMVQLTIPTYELRALRATLKVGRTTRQFSELNITLNTRKGVGITDYTSKQIDGLFGDGRWFAMRTVDVQQTGLVEVDGGKIVPAAREAAANTFAIANLDDSTRSALISARKAVVFPGKEVQFEKADLYVGGSRVMRVPLFKAPLNGANPVFTDQMVNMNDNQLAISYPYYLSLKPGETSLLRFHMGDHTNAFGNANGPQLDYELDWNRGDDFDGGFLLSGLGLRDWGMGFHQSVRFDDRTSANAQLQLPELRSLFGSASMSHQFNGYNANLNGSITQTIVGTPETDELVSFAADRDPQRLGKLPFRYSFGLTAVHQSTSLPVPIRSQDGYGLESRLTMDPRRLDKQTTLNVSLVANQLQGRNVDRGVGLSGALTLDHQLNQFANVLFTYNYTQDKFASSSLGNHQVSAQAVFAKGNASFSLSGSRSLGIDRFDYDSQISYRLSHLLRIASDYVFDSYFGNTFCDFDAAVYFRVGTHEIGLVWSKYTNRLGVQLVSASY